MAGFTFDDAVLSKPREGGGAVHIPQGEYLLEIVSYQAGPEDKFNSDPTHLFGLKVVKGPGGVGQVITEFVHYKEAGGGKKSTFFNLGNFVYAALDETTADKFLARLAPDPATNRPGVSVPDYAAFGKLGQHVFGMTKGKQVYALVADASSNGKTISRVERVGYPLQFDESTVAAPPVSLGPGPQIAPPPEGPANGAVVDDAFMAGVDSLFAGLPTI